MAFVRRQWQILKHSSCRRVNNLCTWGHMFDEVGFRDAGLSRIWKSDYRIRIHRAYESSGQGEAERTNSAVGDAITNGGSIKWEYFSRFHDKSDEEI